MGKIVQKGKEKDLAFQGKYQFRAGSNIPVF